MKKVFNIQLTIANNLKFNILAAEFAQLTDMIYSSIKSKTTGRGFDKQAWMCSVFRLWNIISIVRIIDQRNIHKWRHTRRGWGGIWSIWFCYNLYKVESKTAMFGRGSNLHDVIYEWSLSCLFRYCMYSYYFKAKKLTWVRPQLFSRVFESAPSNPRVQSSNPAPEPFQNIIYYVDFIVHYKLSRGEVNAS